MARKPHERCRGLYNREESGSKGSGEIANIRHSDRADSRDLRTKNQVYLISNNLTSKIRVLLAGIPGWPLLPYASCAGMVILRSPPIDSPAIPISQPLMTSPAPSLKVNGLPLLFAALSVLANGKM